MLFGVGEIIDLDFTVRPPLLVPAGLRWVLVAGGGTLMPGITAGTAVYTAPDTFSIVILQLADGTTTYSTHIITVTPPLDAVMQQEPGTGIWHVQGKWGVGFRGRPFLRPVSVSFSRVQFREGSVAGVTNGTFPGGSGSMHPVGSWTPIGGGNSTTGSRVEGVDHIKTPDIDPPFGTGTFLWAIPWQYQVGRVSGVQFTTANHLEIAIHNPMIGLHGMASISKKGAGPFRRRAADPTSSW